MSLSRDYDQRHSVALGKRFTTLEDRLTLRPSPWWFAVTPIYPNSCAAFSIAWLRQPTWSRLQGMMRCALILGASLVATVDSFAAEEAGTLLGLPFTRFYSLE